MESQVEVKFSLLIYSEAAIRIAAQMFKDICEVRIKKNDENVVCIFRGPVEKFPIVDEFENLLIKLMQRSIS